MTTYTESVRYYATQSLITDPGQYAFLFDDLPNDIPTLCEVVRGLHMHLEEGELYEIRIPRSRLSETSIRSVQKMLEHIVHRNDRSLIQAREPKQRLVGCCRDFAVMLCAMLRHKGIPARARYGFAKYINHPDFEYVDHVVTEYLHHKSERWVLVDSQLDDRHIKMNRIEFDPHNVPTTEFLFAGEIWRRCRVGEADPGAFGYQRGLKGLWVIAEYVVHDLVSLNKHEMQIMDKWGLSDIGPRGRFSGDDLALLDEAARVTMMENVDLRKLQSLFEEKRLRVPRTLNKYDLQKRRLVKTDWIAELGS